LALIWQNNEKALLLQVANGDEQAFRLLFDAYRDRLFFYTLRITSSRELAEDIVQDTFLKIWLRRDQLSQVDHFPAYIFKVARNGVLSGLRRKAMEGTILAQKMDTGTLEPDMDQQLYFKQVKGVLQSAVDALPPQQRNVYLLRREEDRRIGEIARLMGISEVTVKRHLTQAQKTLRQAILDAFPYESGILVILFFLNH
jgi:RNA polymerase sigma-70 factor (family 1)